MSSYITKRVQLETLIKINLTKSKLIKEKRSKKHQFSNYNITTSNPKRFHRPNITVYIAILLYTNSYIKEINSLLKKGIF
jgi:hypothetical protein